MEPVKFKEQNIVFAENQDPYLPLPAFKCDTPQGEVISCWKMSIWERVKVLFTGRVWLWQLTFNRKLQPQIATVEYPFMSKD